MPSRFAIGTRVISVRPGPHDPVAGSVGIVVDGPSPHTCYVDFAPLTWVGAHNLDGAIPGRTGRIMSDSQLTEYLGATEPAEEGIDFDIGEITPEEVVAAVDGRRRFILGDRVVTTRSHDGARAGLRGTVLISETEHSGLNVGVAFDPNQGFREGHELNGRLPARACGWHVRNSSLGLIPPGEETIPPVLDSEGNPITAGCLVVLCGSGTITRPFGAYRLGIVTFVHHDSVFVRFPHAIGGHVLEGESTPNGKYCLPTSLSVVQFDPNNIPMGSIIRRNDIQRVSYGAVPFGAHGKIVSRMEGGTVSGRAHDYGVDFGLSGITGLHNLAGPLPNGTGYFLAPDLFDVIYLNVDGVEIATPSANTRIPGELWFDGVYNPTPTHGTPGPRGDVVWGHPAPGLSLSSSSRIARSLSTRSLFDHDEMPSASKIPDSFVVTALNSEMEANGIQIGWEGTVRRRYNDSFYVVDFHRPIPGGNDDEGRGSGRRHCLRVPRTHITITKHLAKKEAVVFKKDDRVIMARMGQSGAPPIGTEGIVIQVMSADHVEVDFYPYRWKHGKTMTEALKLGHERSCATIYTQLIDLVTVADMADLKPYHLVAMRDGKTSILEDQPTFDDGKEAAKMASELSKKLGIKVQVRKATEPDANWRDREIQRMKDGIYKPMPKSWDLKPIVDHFLHLSLKNPGFVAYTPSPTYGEQDRQNSTRPGAYVKKFYPDLSSRDVERYNALATCDGQLEIVTSGKEMVDIYRNGPDSCMIHDFVSGQKGIAIPAHPISVYAASDIALAYLRQNGAIIARCLIWPERKFFTRAYGDIAKIIAVLEAEGYTRQNFIGAKLLRIPFLYDGRDYVICPYIDESTSVQGAPGALGVVDDGTNLIIAERGRGQDTNQTHGFVFVEKRYRLKERGSLVDCPRCGDLAEKSEMRPVIVGMDGDTLRFEAWCKSCQRHRAYRCRGFDALVSGDVPSSHDESGDRNYSHLYINSPHSRGYICTLSNYFYTNEPVILHDGSKVSPKYFSSHGYVCAGSGEKFALRHRGSGRQTWESVGGKKYSIDWLKSHPEVAMKADKTDGISAVEKKMKMIKKSASPTMYSAAPPWGSSYTYAELAENLRREDHAVAEDRPVIVTDDVFEYRRR